jgi:hypothetical protein
MGGRKSYTLDSVVGKSQRNAKAKEDFVSSIQSKESKRIVSSALDLFSKSDKAALDLAEAVDAFDFVKSNVGGQPLDYENRKRLASEYWAKRKKETSTPSNSVLDRILVDSIAKLIRRGRRK